MTDFGGSKTPKNERDYWQTPIEIFNALDREFGFWLDAAASESNALCAHYLTELDDSLNSEWTSYGAIWCNPPYSDIGPWVEKAAEQSRAQSQAVRDAAEALNKAIKESLPVSWSGSGRVAIVLDDMLDDEQKAEILAERAA